MNEEKWGYFFHSLGMNMFVGNILFGLNAKSTRPGTIMAEPLYYKLIMKRVGAYNQSQNGGNGYNAGWPFYGEHILSGRAIYYGYRGKKL